MSQLTKLLLLPLLAVVTACSSSTASKSEYGGFLGNYDRLIPFEAADGTKVMGWVAEDFNKTRFDAVMIDPVALSPNAILGERTNPENLNAIRAELHAMMVQEMGKSFRVVDQPGTGVLRYQLSLTGVQAVNRDLRWYEYTPVTFTASQVAAATGVRDDIIEVFVEAKIIDSGTGRIIATAVRKGHSEAIGADEQITADNIGMVLRDWAESSAQGVRNLNAGKVPQPIK